MSMQTLKCQDPVLRLHLPRCSASNVAATLTRAGFESIQTSTNYDSETHTLTFDFDERMPVARGVWELLLRTPDCGCFKAQIWVETCDPLAFIGEHFNDDTTGVIQVCCPDDPDLCVGSDNLVEPGEGEEE